MGRDLVRWTVRQLVQRRGAPQGRNPRDHRRRIDLEAFPSGAGAIPQLPGCEAMNAPLRFDVAVVGGGPAGHHAAIQAAKLGKKVALVDSRPQVGGACVHTGTIPSKTLREAILYLTGYRQRGIYGMAYAVKQAISPADLTLRIQHVGRHETEVFHH